MSTNNFVPFCNENTGTNLPTQADYLADPALPIGNQPGIASSKLNNKAIRQASTMAAVLAQYVSNTQTVDMLDAQNSADHAIPTALLQALTGAFKRIPPVITTYASGSGNHRTTVKFQIASGSATAAATYSDGTSTFTVTTTVASGTEIQATCTSGVYPSAGAGTLTKTGGTGDATLTFYSYRKPICLVLKLVGGGGGGGAAGTAGTGSSGAGGTTTFGTSLLTATGGNGGAVGGSGGGSGGTATVNSPAVAVVVISGGAGSGRCTNSAISGVVGGAGGNSFFGGAGAAVGSDGVAGTAAAVNSGSGGGGGTINAATASSAAGCGGGPGAYIEAIINDPDATYAYAVGAAGTAGTAGTSGSAGGLGGSGYIVVEARFQ